MVKNKSGGYLNVGRGRRNNQNKQLSSVEILFNRRKTPENRLEETEEVKKQERIRLINQPPDEITEDGIMIWKNANGEIHRDGDLPAFIHPDGIKEWWQNGELEREGDKPAVEIRDGEIKEWYQNGKLGRAGGKPASINEFTGKRKWYKDGELHRDGDLPATDHEVDGESRPPKAWYQNDELHRDGDKPALIRESRQEWYQNGKLHREGDLPAGVYVKAGGTLDPNKSIEEQNGVEVWYKDGLKHRTNGPAVIRYSRSGASKEYWKDGERYHENGRPYKNKKKNKYDQPEEEKSELQRIRESVPLGTIKI